MQSQHPLYGGHPAAAAAAAYQNAAAAAGYAAGPGANMNLQPGAPAAAQYNHVVMMPVNHPAMNQPPTAPHHAQYAASAGYPGVPGPREATIMYGGQPAGMMLAAQPMQQGQRSATVPQVTTTVYL